ncbi:hypothetical protein T07_14830 [Trichinella nelsoni]|uniref:Uncharacterized protein n=1 Tax=Trichinella nelsoni TaxID=6336 RepID=A0A0V0RTA7_9BILA|nr:hypothetical protein T07_14830 [Trichinella nelsoni]
MSNILSIHRNLIETFGTSSSSLSTSRSACLLVACGWPAGRLSTDRRLSLLGLVAIETAFRATPTASVLNWSSTRTRQCVEHTRDAAAVGLIRAFQSRERKLAYCHIWADACFAADKQAQSAGCVGNDHVGNSSCRGYRRGKWRNSNEPLLLYKRPPTVALANLACDSPQIARAYNYQEQLIQNWNRSVVTVSVDNVVWVTVSAPQGRVAQWRRMSRPSALFSEAAASNLGSPPVS